jgi:hypothetical protein
VFLDTPHRGCHISTWPAVYGGVGNDLAHAQLGQGSTELADLDRMFSNIGNHVHITSCFAREPTVTSKGDFMVCTPRCEISSLKFLRFTPIIQVVHEDAVVLGNHSERVLHLSNVSHITMCRIPAAGDHVYQLLQGRLKAELLMSSDLSVLDGDMSNLGLSSPGEPAFLCMKDTDLAPSSSLNYFGFYVLLSFSDYTRWRSPPIKACPRKSQCFSTEAIGQSA